MEDFFFLKNEIYKKQKRKDSIDKNQNENQKQKTKQKLAKFEGFHAPTKKRVKQLFQILAVINVQSNSHF